ncbi:MAG: helix-turn-helix domain-containing protein [Rhizobiales bacterium]|nr:helix-turn-helix domain-containing protein [Hyphomicrobiales bacterium]NRB15288.1 helix-turn-helix domain-containing protein [Hyphomicrobiales bacterium]
MNNITSLYSGNGFGGLDKCNNCPVRGLSFCSALDTLALEEFSALSKTRSFTDGQLILTEGEVNEYIGSITEGIVKVYKLLNDGRQQIISLGFPGDMLGNIIDAEYNYFVEAVGKVKICLYRVSRIASFAATNPEIYLSILGKTNQQLSHARDWLVLLGRKTAKEKIASFLLLLSEHHLGSETDQAFKIPLKRQEIADFLGLTIETVSRNFSSLKNQQLIREQAGHMLIIVDYSALKNIS